MSECARIAQQMKQAFEGGAWHGPSLLEILGDVSAETASARPVPGGHNIWEIVLHLIATQKMLVRRLNGDATAKNLPPEEDWPPMPEVGEQAWTTAMELLALFDGIFRDGVAAFPDERLDEPFIPGGSTAYTNFHGYIQHNLYHAGQIALLKKTVLKQE